LTKPTANIPLSTVNRIQTLILVKERTDDGATSVQIAEELGVGKDTVDQYRRNIKELLELGLTPDTINEKRGELYLEYCDAATEAKQLFIQYRDAPEAKSTDKKRMLMAWVEILDRKAKLWGFDNVRIDVGQINTQINQGVEIVDKIDKLTKQKIASAIKDDFERKLQEKHNEYVDGEIILDAE